jgi:hypothetical protein
MGILPMPLPKTPHILTLPLATRFPEIPNVFSVTQLTAHYAWTKASPAGCPCYR